MIEVLQTILTLVDGVVEVVDSLLDVLLL